MKRSSLCDMGKVTEALYLDEFEKLRPILAAEARIRRQLARLDAQAEETRRAAGQMFDYRSFGADMLWRGWESRTRQALNMELARVRALKLTAMDGLRLAHGRRQAIGDLASQLQSGTARRRRQVLLENLCLSDILNRVR